MNDNKEILDLRRMWAVRLARAGLGIFPLPIGAKVAKVKFNKIATTDLNTINAWFDRTPKMNYGVCDISGKFAIIDIDTKAGKEGDLVFEEVECQQDIEEWVTDNTLNIITPSNGKHKYTRVPYKVTNSTNFEKDIDIKGFHGYVVGPYCWTQEEKDKNAKGRLDKG